MDRFVLVPDGLGARLRAAVPPIEADRRLGPGGEQELPSLLAELAGVTEMLVLRHDVRVIVNGAVRNAGRERIALGLHFARAF